MAMLKILPTLLLLALATVASGQISLTSAYFPSGGDTLFITTTPDNSTVDLLAPGGPRNWDFSQLTAGINLRRPVENLAPNGPDAAFPEANLKIQMDLFSTNYYVRTPTELRLVGNVGGTQLLPGFTVTTPFSPPYIERRAPLNFLDQFQSNPSILVALSVDSLPQAILDLGGLLLAGFDSIRVRTLINRLDLVDGYGDLNVGGSIYSVLREKRTEIRDIRLEAKLGFLPWTDITSLLTASVPALAQLVGRDTLVSYTFWNNESIESIAVVETEADGSTITNISYKTTGYQAQ
ncbi:MAG: hypothetical protein HC821_01750 [Lewinella sp.]|nr:hypothetical protein [Lewinella sp.]